MRIGYLTLMDNPPAYGSERRDPGQLLLEVVDQAVQADQAGFSSAWLPEHHFGFWSTCPCTAVALAQIAARTRRIRLGPAISVLPYNDPLRVAEEYATLDVLSGGRVDFAAGRGFERSEYAAFGVDYEESRDRLREGMDFIRRAWTQRRLDFAGRFRQAHGLEVLPRPVQQPHPPMFVGSFSGDSLQLAAEDGYNVMFAAFAAANVYANVQEAARRFHDLARSHGHAGLRAITSFMGCICHDRDEQEAARMRLLKHFRGLLPPGAEQLAQRHPHIRYFLETCELLRQEDPAPLVARGLLIGDAQTWLAELADCARSGISEALLYLPFGGCGHAEALAAIERVALEVLAHAAAL